MKLHLGCGQRYFEGYLNIYFPSSCYTMHDKSFTDQRVDILALRYPLGSIDEVRLHHVFEHSPNPILLLLNLYLITRKGGYQFHAIPHYKYTYDSHRNPTDIEHLVSDFENKTDWKDISHNDDYIISAIEKIG